MLCDVFLSRKSQGLPNNPLHTIKTTKSIQFILLYIFDFIPKLKQYFGLGKRYKFQIPKD